MYDVKIIIMLIHFIKAMKLIRLNVDNAGLRIEVDTGFVANAQSSMNVKPV